MSANTRQVGGDHYKIGGEEHWDRVARLDMDYFQGQITKYVERWKKKNGLQDLEKARHFLDKYIEIEKSKAEAVAAPKPIPSKILPMSDCVCECHRGAGIVHVVACCGGMIQFDPSEPDPNYVNQDR